MLAALCTRITSCSADQVRFFSMLRYWANVLLFNAGDGPFFLMSDPSFWCSFRYRWSASYSGKVCCLRQPSSCSPVCRDRASVNSQLENWQWWQCSALLWALHSVPLATDSWIPTALVVRHCTAMQSSLWLLCFPLSCQQTWCCSCWVCAMEDRSQNQCLTLTYSMIFAIRLLTCWSNVLLRSSLDCWATRLLSCCVSSPKWGSGQSLPAPILWLHVCAFLLFCFASAVDCERVDRIN